MSDKEKTDPIYHALNRIHQQFFSLSLDHDPKVPYDKDWLSPCLKDFIPDVDQKMISWRPVKWGDKSVFESLESALELRFHSDILSFYTSYWSEGFWGHYQGYEMSLIQVWNEDDLDMLKQNLLGHAFATRKNKVSFTLFIGCTDDDVVVSLDNATGKVGLERPGAPQHKILSDSLETFLSLFEPSKRLYTEV
jgi:SecY interacting protein Syd